MRKKVVILLCLSLFLFILGAGCQSVAKKPTVPEQRLDQQSNNNITASERRVMASKFSQIAENVDGVEKASVVVASTDIVGVGVPGLSTKDNMDNNKNNAATDVTDGNNMLVMVGLVLDEDVRNDVNKASNIRQTVSQKIKASDNRVSQVLVTTDPNLAERINNLAEKVIKGEPIENFKADLKDLKNKIK